jgi:hypothetical protein
VKQLWQVLLEAKQAEDEPLSCEDCYILMDFFGDLLSGGYPSEEVLPLADRYLRRCPANCRREYRAMAQSLLLTGEEKQQLWTEGA